MIRWTYKHSEARLWTTGFTDPAGKWHPDKDHGDPDAARQRAAWLNGTAGNNEDEPVHVYLHSEPGLWTTGHYEHADRGRFWPVSDHSDEQEAARQCAELNGSTERSL